MLLNGANMKENVKDVQVWGKEVTRLFSVNSAYDCLDKQSRGPCLEVFKLLWKAKAFPNVVTTAWRVLLGRIPTMMNLSNGEYHALCNVPFQGGVMPTSFSGV